MKKNPPKYKKGDIVGVCHDAMYEFEVLCFSKKQSGYHAKCVKSYTETIKVGAKHLITEKQVVVKLGEKGVKWPV